ncbi:MAG TPA: CoA transferase [Gammaproteobacteria bacterium]|nr:CoA transferase [Gammaproteobacteria bacterium]
MEDVLAGIRVLDFGRYIAGPFCAALLGDLGADVIRIERREGGEDRWLQPVAPDGVGALFLAMNRNKRGMTLDPAQPEGREIVRRLVATADVVVANLPPEVLKSLALDLESLRAVQPEIILTTATAFGLGGPWSHKHGFDGIGQAMCGSVYLTGEAGHPTRATVNWVDCGTAAVSAFGTLAALMARGKRGQGQQVEASLLRTAIAFNNAMLIEQALAQTNRVAVGNLGIVSAPSDLYATRDGWVMVSSVGTPMFRRWAKLVGATDWLEDPRFADDVGRAAHGAIVSARMREWVATRTTDEVLAELESANVPAAPVLSPQQALAHPHIAAAGLLEAQPYPGLDRAAPIAAPPVALSATPGRFHRPPPALGEHTDEILGELGYDASAIADLRERRII